MLTVEHWPLQRLIPYARNPRKNDQAVDRMCAAIREFQRYRRGRAARPQERPRGRMPSRAQSGLTSTSCWRTWSDLLNPLWGGKRFAFRRDGGDVSLDKTNARSQQTPSITSRAPFYRCLTRRLTGQLDPITSQSPEPVSPPRIPTQFATAPPVTVTSPS